MEWTFLDTWIVIIGALSAMACALLGNYLVLRKMSMMGDAISHAVLPGLAVAFLITGSRDSLPMLIGAIIVGVITAFLIQGVGKLGKLDQGAAMGVIFTTLFAIGLILIRQAADHVDLDPSCVLYGAIELTPLDTQRLCGWEIPRAALINGAALFFNVVFVVVFFKELKITAFDPALAATLGVSPLRMHYALMSLVAVTAIAAFESVGSILVIAMLIVPGACAHLLTDRLPVMLILSLVIAAATAVFGHMAAVVVPGWFGFRDTSTAGMMSVAAGVIFAAVFLLAPRYGLCSRFLNQIRTRMTIVLDDMVGILYRIHESKPRRKGPAASLHIIRRALKTDYPVWIGAFILTRRGLIHTRQGKLILTEKGLARGRRLIRSHRLWEAYLCKHMDACADDVHFPADQLEHYTDAVMQDKLSQAAGNPTVDPHNEAIPGPNPKER